MQAEVARCQNERLLLLVKNTANVQDDPGPSVYSGLNIHAAEMQDEGAEQSRNPGRAAACTDVSA